MFNLDLYDLEFNQELPENVCQNATHVAYCRPKLFILKNEHVEYYESLFGIVEQFDHQNHKIPIPSHPCITQFTYLSAKQKLWFGNGKQFVCICPLSCSVTFILNEENEFDVAEWNSLQEILAIIRTDGKIGTYMVDFTNCCLLPLNSAHINDENLCNSSVNIGWGSELTQFDHSKVKQIAASKKAIEDGGHNKTTEEPKQIQDDMKPRLSWKPDGSMFAVNCYINGKRKIKLYSSICELFYIYEDIIGLQPIIVWRPSSTLISTVVWTNKQYSFVLLGRSSSEKSVFELQLEEKIEEIKWNPFGPELAIRQRNSEDVTAINLYTFLNFKWYLKQCLRFTPQNRLVAFEFVGASNQCILQVATFKEIVTYYFKSDVHYYRGVASKDDLPVAVIDGRKLCLSFCKEGAIPLPLHHLIITTNNPINCVTFHPEKQMLAALDSANTFNIYSYSTDSFELVCKFNIPCLDDTHIPLRIRNIHWRNDKQIVCLKNESSCKKKMRHVYYLNMNGELEEWNFVSRSPHDENVHCLNVLRNSDTLILHTEVGTVAFDSDDKNVTIVNTAVRPYLDAVVVCSKLYVFELTATHSFMINNLTVNPFIKSFVVHDNYLILLSDEYQLTVVRLNSASLKDLCDLKFDNCYTRPVDSGSRLLFALPNNSNVVIENRRGNYELYTCRIITIDRVESLIRDHKWLAAFNILRLEKVDFNVIIDLDAHWFLENVDTFIENVQSSSIVNEFLVSLNDDNVFHTLYKECALKLTEKLKNKCTLVCEAMIKSMQEYNYIHFIKSISIAEIMKSESSVRGALEHISYLLSGSTVEQSYTGIAETTLLTIQNLKPNLELYKTALSMYNLELAGFIASVTSVDPSEYQPVLSALENLEECTKRWTINNHLKQFYSALPFCLRLGNDDDVYKYIVQHDLAKFACPLLKGNSQLYYKVLNIVTSKLSDEGKHDEAAAMYLQADLKWEALNQYVTGLYWKQALLLMQQLDVQPVVKSNFLSNIVEGLINKGNILVASHILDEHLHNYEEAVKILLQHEMFTNAVEIAQKHNRSDIIENDVKIAIENYLKLLIQKFSKIEEDFNKYKSRLMELRKEKQDAYFRSINLGNNTHEAAPDEYDEVRSQGESTISGMSTSTFRTGFTVKSGRRRKAERRKENLRIGSHFEDIALIKILYNLIDEIFKYGPQIHDVLVTLIAVKYGVKPFMVEVHNKLLLLQKSMNSAVKDIWPAEMNSVEGNNIMHVNVFVYRNMCDLDVKYRAPPSKLDMNWTVHTLLGLEEST